MFRGGGSGGEWCVGGRPCVAGLVGVFMTGAVERVCFFPLRLRLQLPHVCLQTPADEEVQFLLSPGGRGFENPFIFRK